MSKSKMEEREFLRIVALRSGKLKPAEFKLREGEKGLSLCAHRAEPNAREVIDAVRAAGKQGFLAAAVIPAQQIASLGLRLLQTQGGTLAPRVNAIHYEARVPFLRKLFLRLWGIRHHDYFNDYLSPKLWALARVLE
jgi:hypothetical protein